VVVVEATPTDPDGDTHLPELISPNELGGSLDNATLSLDSGSSGQLRVEADGDPVWEWRHHIAREAQAAVDPFVEELIRRGLIRQGADLQDPKVRASLIRTHRDELAASYKAAIRSVGASLTRNATSLMLYSGPPVGTRYRSYRTRPRAIERAEVGAWGPHPGWLALGDADLRAKRRIDEVEAAFHNRKPYVGTFAPSHHGSHLDWSPVLTAGFHENGYQPTYVFGASGHYGHPRGEVLLDINEAGGTAVIVGLAESSRWTESLCVYVSA
jgi:hypothetical protein